MIELRTLGTIDLRERGTGRDLRSLPAQEKRAALLFYLALPPAGGFRRRDELLGVFWPELPEDRARAALRQALHVLRRALGPRAIATHGDAQVGFDPDAIWCDAAAFDAALRAGDVLSALELYRGDLLPGFHASGSPSFEHWLEDERTRLREAATRAAWQLSERKEAEGEVVEAVHWARRATMWCRYDEVRLRRLLELLDRVGDGAGALREYQTFRRRLAEDLELEPARETQELAERIIGASAAAPTPQPPTKPALADGGAAGVAATGDGDAPPVSGAHPARNPTAARPRRTPVPRRAAFGAVVALLFLVVAAVLVEMSSGRHPGDPLVTGAEAADSGLDAQRVLVTDFANETGDPRLDGLGRMAADWISQELRQLGALRIISPLTVQDLMGRFEAESNAVPDPRPALALARDARAGLVITGAFYRSGDSLFFQAAITDAASGTIVRSIEPIAGRADVPVEAVERLRGRLVGALASRMDQRTASWSDAASQPPDLLAYREYATGLDHFFRTDWSRAADHFYRAAAVDSSFTAPLIWAMFAHANGAQYAVLDSLVEAVGNRRSRLPPWDRLLLDYHQAFGRGDRPAMHAAAVRISELTPGSEWEYLRAFTASEVGHYREAVDVLSALDPDRGWMRRWPSYWWILATAFHHLGEFDRGLQVAEEYVVRYPDVVGAYNAKLRALGALGRADAMEDVITAFRNRLPGAEWRVSDLARAAAHELRAHGHTTASDSLLTRLLVYESGAPSAELQASIPPGAGGSSDRTLADLAADHLQISRMVTLQYLGRWSEAAAVLDSVLVWRPGPPVDPWVLLQRGMIAASNGDRVLATRMSEQLASIDRPYWFGGPTEFRARIAAVMGDRDRAVALLARAMAEGSNVYRHAHRWPAYLSLRGYPPFEQLIAPREHGSH